MREKSSSLLNVALAASFTLHALMIGGASLRGHTAALESELSIPDRWSASSVEVGTIASEPAPARAEPAPSPAKDEALRIDKAPEAPPIRAPWTEAAREAAGGPPAAKPASASHRAQRPAARPSSVAVKAEETACTRGCEKTVANGAAGAAQTPDPSTAGGELGDTGLPPGVRHFATAFVRAVPAASYSDAAWSELPVGVVGTFIVEIQMDAEGRIAEIEFEPRAPPPVLKRMADRAILLLKSGIFSLDRKTVQAGIERLSLEVTLSEAANDPDEAQNPRHLRALGYEAPTRSRAGYARFTLNSGREMRAVVRRIER